MKIQATFPVLAALLIAPALWGQASNPATSGMKVGVINIQAAIAGTAEGKQASAELQSQFSPRTTELQNYQKQGQDLNSRLQNGQTTLSDEEKARLQRQLDVLNRTFQRKQQEFQEDTQDAQNEVVNRIGRKMMDVLDKYAKDNSYSVILDESSQQTPVIYAANQVDVTQEIIHLYDQAYPVKTASNASPGATRPAPKPAPVTPKPQP